MTNKKIVISFQPQPRGMFDFGNFKPSYKNYTIKIDPELWKKYVIARRDFEILHEELMKLAWKRCK